MIIPKVAHRPNLPRAIPSGIEPVQKPTVTRLNHSAPKNFDHFACRLTHCFLCKFYESSSIPGRVVE
jgi:hypothetical protein